MLDRLSLKQRIVSSSTLLIVIFGLSITLVIHGAVRTILTTEVKKRGVAIAHGLQQLSVSPLLTENFVSLSLMLDDVIRTEKGIRYIFVLDGHRHPVAHTFADGLPPDLVRQTGGERTDTLLLKAEEGSFYDIVVPIMKGDLGEIHVGMDADAPRSEVDRIILLLMGMVTGFGILSALVGRWIAGSLTRPLEDLHRAVLRIAEGDFAIRLGMRGGDEIALLASDFDVMAEKLQDLHRMLAAETEAHRTAADEVRRLNANLEQLVAERTRQLEESNRDLESFCYSVSHDLIAPLRHIIAFSRILEEDHRERLGDEGVAHLDRIANGARRMAELIDDLLELSRVGRQDLERRPVDLSLIAERIVQGLREAEPDRRVTVRITPGMTATGDPRLIDLLLQNLLQNAWKYTAGKQGAEIVFTAVEEGGERVFMVKDDGIGFDMKYADKLFGVFQRLVSDREFPGTGIGLAIVHRIVTRHGGRVWGEGRPGEGATFSFTLGEGEC